MFCAENDFESESGRSPESPQQLKVQSCAGLSHASAAVDDTSTTSSNTGGKMTDKNSTRQTDHYKENASKMESDETQESQISPTGSDTGLMEIDQMEPRSHDLTMAMQEDEKLHSEGAMVESVRILSSEQSLPMRLAQQHNYHVGTANLSAEVEVAADVINAAAGMTSSLSATAAADTSPVSSLTSPSDSGTRDQPSSSLSLPDVVSVHSSPSTSSQNLSFNIRPFFITSSESKNYSERCSSADSSESCNCKKRSAFVFPELVADDGECLCSKRPPPTQTENSDSEIQPPMFLPASSNIANNVNTVGQRLNEVQIRDSGNDRSDSGNECPRLLSANLLESMVTTGQRSADEDHDNLTRDSLNFETQAAVPSSASPGNTDTVSNRQTERGYRSPTRDSSLCISTGLEICQSRSASIFPELVADGGGCLCSGQHSTEPHTALMSDSSPCTMLPDVILSHNGNASQISKMTQGKTILVTGGAGYIGSHSVIELVEAGYDIVVIDNLVNASMESIRRVEKIVGKEIPSYTVDLLDKIALDEIFKKHSVSAVIHFAGLKAVGESCERPLLYYRTNVGGTTNLLEVMEANNVSNLVFSSSATVYGKPQFLPLTEDHPVGGCTNTYGKTKFMTEQILSDICNADKKWNVVILRYFNPVGAHKSGTIGEDPSGVPNNLMPFIGQVAVGRRPCLKVYGNDYDTHDGTGVRDYIHVVDLAAGHVAAVRKLEEQCRLKVYNLGTGHGYSVLDMIKAFEKASGKKIPYDMEKRRPGDIATYCGDPSLAGKELKWKAEKGLDEMCADLWRWQSQNPKGYNTGDQQ